MKIASSKLFFFSLASLVTTLLIGYQFQQMAAMAVTRDFNFGEPLGYGLILIQTVISLAGMAASLKKSAVTK